MALQRVTVGFSNGTQPLALRIEDAALDGLMKAVTGGDWHDLPVDGGTVRLNLSQVVYVRTERDEQRVGFGAS